MGNCFPLGGADESCLYNPNSNTNYLDGLVYKCPCANGLKCVSTGFFVVPLGFSGVCTA